MIILGKNISKRVDMKFLFINIKFFLSKARNFHAYDEDIIYIVFIDEYIFFLLILY